MQQRCVRYGRTLSALSIVLSLAVVPSAPLSPQTIDRGRDRGTGIPLSMFGTYIEPRELIVYPFVEYYRDSDAEYSPEELGYGLNVDFRGRYRGLEGLIFLAYGISDRFALEVEAAVIKASQEKAPEDPTAMPLRLEESGLGDVEGQIRWRWTTESDSRPEIFSYFETVFPLQKEKRLIGTQAWELKLGTGVVRGFTWGTLTLRLAAEYDAAERTVEAGEYAIEYLRRVSPRARVFFGVEGSQDEVEAIPELQLFLRPNVVVKLNSAFGVSSKATDWAPEIGVMVGLR